MEGSVHAGRGEKVGALRVHETFGVAWLDDACWDPLRPWMEQGRILAFVPLPSYFFRLHRQSSCRFACPLLVRSIAYLRGIDPIDLDW